MVATRNDLPEHARLEMAKLLNARLADLVDLQTQVKQAHWNVKGPHFIGLHELFDRIAESMAGYADAVAERAVQLGGVAEGTARVAAARSAIAEYPLDIREGRAHCQSLSDRLAILGRLVREAIEQANAVKDLGTADLFTEISRGLDKWLWFVEAHLQAEG